MKKFKSQASSSRAASGALGAGAFGAFSKIGADHGDLPSTISYIFEPPDLSLISQRHVVVTFKNLLKKDSTTKLKALEDILDFISEEEEEAAEIEKLEDGFLEAWVKLYPRVSIDASRRVRQLSHILQGFIVSRAGKRIARYIPRVIGAWLAGLYDNDKLAVKAAHESFIRAFPTEEKRQAIWKVYQSAIIGFVVDAVVQQTPLTLSDERSVRPDEAEAKYARVVATALQMLNRLFAKVSRADLEKDSQIIQGLFANRSLWELAHHEDSFVRRSIYRLCQRSVSVVEEYTDWETISKHLLSKSLSINQHGSASEFSTLLLNLTQIRPQIWSTDYSGKAAASKRFLQYIRAGSQGASPEYWQNIRCLLQTMPLGDVFPDAQDSNGARHIPSAVMEALLEGISHREEPRSTRLAAWSSYIEVGAWALKIPAPTDSQMHFIRSHLFPIVQNYVSPTDQMEWTIHHKDAVFLCAQCFVSIAETVGKREVSQLWMTLSEPVSENIKSSTPENSDDYTASQDTVAFQSHRLFNLEARILEKIKDLPELSFMMRLFSDTTLSLVHTSLRALVSQKGAPYGIAAVVEEALTNVPQYLKDDGTLKSFLADEASDLINSPSSSHIAAVIFACREQMEFPLAFANLVKALQKSELTTDSASALQVLFTHVTKEDIALHPQFENLVTKRMEQALQGNKPAWEDIVLVICNSDCQDGTSHRALARLAEALFDEETILQALYGFSFLVNLDYFKTFITGPEGSKLMSRLIFLSESTNEQVSRRATSLQSAIESSVERKSRSQTTVDILQNNFANVGPESLSVDALVEIATDNPRTSEDPAGIQTVDLFPNAKQWSAALEHFLHIPPPTPLSLLSPLGGAVFSMTRPKRDSDISTIPRDSNQVSLAGRLMLYVMRMLSTVSVDDMDPSLREALFLNIPLVTHLIDDELNMEGTTMIVPLDYSDARTLFTKTVDEAKQFIKHWVDNSSTSGSPPGISDAAIDIVGVWQGQLEQLKGSTAKAYRYADAYTRILSERDALGKAGFPEQPLHFAQNLESSSNPFVMVAVINAFKTSFITTPAATRMCNQLISQATELDEKSGDEGLWKLVTLNALIQGDGAIIEKIATQRLVFLVKNLIRCLQSERLSFGVEAEFFKALTIVFPQIKEIYGSHWMDALVIIQSLWQGNRDSEDYLPALHASLRLLSCLMRLASSESNDDLADAWKETENSHGKELISLLSDFDSSFYPDTPWNMTIELLDRQIKQLSVDHVEDVTPLFATLSIQSKSVQDSTYDVLHRVLPGLQRTASLNAALSRIKVHLPDELLSLLVDVPAPINLSRQAIPEDIWMDIRCYLLGWRTVFDYFAFSSLPIQETYAIDIKDYDCVDPLLDFMFECLETSQGKLVDASKFDIRSLEPSDNDSPEKEIQLLLAHTYYLCLRYLPNLAKAWWADSKKRVKGPVEAWTQKFISPLVIEDSLQSVSEWFEAQDWTGEKQPLHVKVSQKAAEIVASIEIDEESPSTSITISLPPTYPLQQAAVISGYRVVVDEKKWKSWLMTIQGVIMFSNGNLVDGLRAFRKNVQGALKGQGECAICYSVISANMQTPNKKCATCKNTFHTDCLFKWFKSSNSSSCPLCRNNFLYS